MLLALQFSAFFQMFFISAANLIPIYWQGIDHFTLGTITGLNSLALVVGLIGPLLFGKELPFKSEWITVACFVFSGLLALGLWISPSPLFQTINYAILQLLRVGILTLVPTAVLYSLGQNAARQYGSYRRIGSLGFLVGVVLAGYFAKFFGIIYLPILLCLSALMASAPFWRKIKFPRSNLKQGSYKEALSHPVLRPLLLGYMLISAWSAGVFTLMPLRMHQLGATTDLIGWTLSMCGITALITLVPIGKLIDRKSPSKLYLCVPFFASLRLLLMSLPQVNAEWFLLIQLLHIPTWVLGEAIQIKLIRQYAPPHLYSRSMALMSIGLSLGIAIASALASALSHYLQLSNIFAILSMMPLLAFPWTWNMHRDLCQKQNPIK